MRGLVMLFLLWLPGAAACAQRITRERIIDRTSNLPYLGCLYTPTGSLLVNHSVYQPSPIISASYYQLVSRQLDSLGVGPVLPNSEWRAQATVRAPGGGYAVATTAVSPNWPAERTDLAFYRFANPLVMPFLTRIQDLDGGSNDYSMDILPAANGYFIGAGVDGRSDRKRFKLLKTDTTGTILWQKDYGVSINDFIVGMRYTNDGNIVLAGESSPPPSYEMHLRLLLVNPRGDSLASLSYALPQSSSPNTAIRANFAVEDRLLALRGGGFAMLAELDTTGATYSVVLKVNRRLQPRWQFTYRAPPLFGLPRRMFFAGACELRDSSVLVLASNLNGGPFNNPYYLLRLDGATGQLRNTYQLLSTFCSQFHATKLLPDGDSAVFALGLCNGRAYAAHISLRGLPAVVLATTAPARGTARQLEVDGPYPTPAQETAMLTYRCPPGLMGPGTVRVRDVLGREVWQRAVAASSTGQVSVPTAALASGLYLCEVSWPNQVSTTRKLLVQH